MNRSRCKNKYLKNRTVDNWERYWQLRNKCVKLTKKVKTNYFKNINMQSIIDNKFFWKTVHFLFGCPQFQACCNALMPICSLSMAIFVEPIFREDIFL